MTNQGFFKLSSLQQSKAPTPRVAQCGACGLFKTCQSPKMAVSGEGRRGILVIGESPGEREDFENTQLVGRSGQRLRDELRRFGVDLDRDCWKTNSLICHPKNNATPTDKQIGYCRPNLLKAIDKLKPHTIILLGGAAVRSLIGHLWKEDPGGIGRWVGWQIPSIRLNAYICPTWHPAYLLRMENQALDVWFSRHIEAAVNLQRRPHTHIPEYNRAVCLMHNPSEARGILDMLAAKETTVAFDYETDRLKPDHRDAKIVCCSVAWNTPAGMSCIAYPWVGAAITATQRLLKSRSKKIASNKKFEERWTLKEFGHGVRNWYWDTMQNAHILDNRPGITSIKFQAFTYLGVDTWNSHVEQYLKADFPNQKNRIDECDLDDLLRYCAYDSLYEYLVAAQQHRAMGLGGLY